MDNTAADSLPVPQDFDAPAPAAEAKPAPETPKVDAKVETPAAAAEPVEDAGAEGDEQPDAKDGEQPTDEEVSEAARKLAKRGSPQARIDKAVAKQREAERRAEELARELETLRAGKAKELPADEGKTPDQKVADEKAALKAQYEKYATSFTLTPDDFDTYEQFSAAQAAHVGQQIAKEEKAAEAARVEQATRDRATETVLASHNDRLEAFRKSTPDFDAVMADAPAVTRTMFREMVESDAGPAIAYHLALNPEEAARITALPEKQQIKEIGKLEAQLAAASASTQTPTADSGPARPKVTKPSAPKPMKPVGGGAAPSSVPLDQADPDDYIAIRNKEERERRKAGGR